MILLSGTIATLALISGVAASIFFVEVREDPTVASSLERDGSSASVCVLLPIGVFRSVVQHVRDVKRGLIIGSSASLIWIFSSIKRAGHLKPALLRCLIYCELISHIMRSRASLN